MIIKDKVFKHYWYMHLRYLTIEGVERLRARRLAIDLFPSAYAAQFVKYVDGRIRITFG